MLKVDVWADVTCPWSYLSIRHLRAALSSFPHADKVEIRLHSFFLDPELQQVQNTSHALYMVSSHGVELPEVLDMYTRFDHLGQAEGIRFNFDRLVVAPPTRAFAALAYAREHDMFADTTTGPDTTTLKLYEALCRAHFELGATIADPEVIIGCAQDVGLNPSDILDAVENSTYIDQTMADYHAALHFGITAVPTMLINDEFIIPGMQTVTALTNILTTAWDATKGKDQE